MTNPSLSLYNLLDQLNTTLSIPVSHFAILNYDGTIYLDSKNLQSTHKKEILILYDLYQDQDVIASKLIEGPLYFYCVHKTQNSDKIRIYIFDKYFLRRG